MNNIIIIILIVIISIIIINKKEPFITRTGDFITKNSNFIEISALDTEAEYVLTNDIINNSINKNTQNKQFNIVATINNNDYFINNNLEIVLNNARNNNNIINNIGIFHVDENNYLRDYNGNLIYLYINIAIGMNLLNERQVKMFGLTNSIIPIMCNKYNNLYLKGVPGQLFENIEYLIIKLDKNNNNVNYGFIKDDLSDHTNFLTLISNSKQKIE